MTEEQKKKLHERLMQNVDVQLKPGTIEWRMFDQSVTEDIAAIEPLIDEMLIKADGDATIAALKLFKLALRCATEQRGELGFYAIDEYLPGGVFFQDTVKLSQEGSEHLAISKDAPSA